jgi:hypothetical protein
MKIKLLILIVFVFAGCTETYVLKTEDFQDALVIEATITNEFKKQNIILSRTSPLNETGQRFEHNAIVSITTDTGLVYDFVEADNIYTSVQEFNVLPNISYQLSIQTQDGKHYESSNELMPPISTIDTVNSFPSIEMDELGVLININSFDPTNNSKFYRYEFEETYKIIAPLWRPDKIEFGSFDRIIISPRTTESRVCYSNSNSNSINIITTSDQNEDRISNFPITFIPKTDPKIKNRYSILVKQYILNNNTYSYYKTLKTLTTSGNLLSQIQPGLINGNIKNVNDSNEIVVGYFDVCTISTKRHFFNFDDIYPNEESDAYFTECFPVFFQSRREELSRDDIAANYYYGARALLRSIVMRGTNSFVYYGGVDGGDIQMVSGECGDCTTFSSNVRPSFWVD